MARVELAEVLSNPFGRPSGWMILRRMQATVWVEVGKGTNRCRRPVQLRGHGGYDAQNVDLAIRVEGGDTFG